VLAGGLLLTTGRSTLHQVLAERDFLAVPGQLLSVGVEEQESWRPLGRPATVERPRAFYAYFHDGVEYEGTQISPAMAAPAVLATFQRHAIHLLEANRPVLVYVNPDEPRQSYLVVRADWYLLGPIIVLQCSLACAAGILGWCLHRWNRRGIPPGSRARSCVLGTGLCIGTALLCLGARCIVLGGSSWALVAGALVLLLFAILWKRGAGRWPGLMPSGTHP
jgi:hypothetical protein